VAQIVLVHSPLVGASSWQPVARVLRAEGFEVSVPSLAGIAGAPRPRWRFAVDRVLDAIGTGNDVVLAGHSGASVLLPAVVGRLGDAVASVVLVDAPVPPRARVMAPVPAVFREFLVGLAGDDGRLPVWSHWWDEAVFAELVPDARLRAALEADMEPLPLAYFDEEVPVPAGWEDRRIVYVHLSDAYAEDAAVARERGWGVVALPGRHLDIATRPELVADVLRREAGPDGR
jgi:hypothetical protein